MTEARQTPTIAGAPASRPRPALASRLAEDGAALLPGGLAVAVMIAWAASGGGYETQPAVGASYHPDSWYLGALALVGLLAVASFGLGRVRLSRWATAGLAAFSAYVVWSFLSILWAHDQGTALLGSNRALVYLAAYALFAILPWRPSSLIAALGTLVAGFGVIAVITAVKVAIESDPSGLFIAGGRLSFPLGYENATAALFMLTAITSIALSARREAPAVLRVAGLVSASVCLQLAVLSQSRGWLFTAPIILLLAFAVLPGRLRFGLFALGPALSTAVSAPALLKVYASASVGGARLVEPQLGHALHVHGRHAIEVMLLVDAVLLVAMAVAVGGDRRVRISEPLRRTANRLATAFVVLALAAGVAGGLIATHGHVVRRIDHAWKSFANTADSQSGSSRFTSLGSQRADFWRVALDAFADHPLNGLGQDNFAEVYLQRRHTGDEPRWVHSLELRLLAHTGVVGLLLFAAFLVAAMVTALRAPRTRPDARLAAATALLPVIVWLVHGSIDWFWEFPTLSVPALAFLGGAAAITRPSTGVAARARPHNPRTGRRRVTALVATAASLGALAILAVPYVAAREVQHALNAWPTDPALAYRQLHDASDLLPFNAQTDIVGGAIALNRNDRDVAGGWFETAVRHDPHGWLAPFALGLLASDQHRPAQARRDFAVAHALNPKDPLIASALARSSTRHPLTLAEVQSAVNQRSVARFGR
jgi:hypothetical protein